MTILPAWMIEQIRHDQERQQESAYVEDSDWYPPTDKQPVGKDLELDLDLD